MKTIIYLILSLAGFSLLAQKQLGTDTIYMNVTVAQAKNIVDTTGINPDFIVLDIRTPTEYANGHIINAINIDYYGATFSAQLDALDHNKMYLLHCASGGRSTPTFASMQVKHFREVYHMNNGFNAWFSAGYPYYTGYTFAEGFIEPEKTILFANNAESYLTVINSNDRKGKILLYDLTGKILLENDLKEGLQQFDISSLSSGLYVVILQSPEEQFTKKIFVP